LAVESTHDHASIHVPIAENDEENFVIETETMDITSPAPLKVLPHTVTLIHPSIHPSMLLARSHSLWLIVVVIVVVAVVVVGVAVVVVGVAVVVVVVVVV
jgi:hypothetical protein